ncbi:unnamed protein product [Schistosoma mattheei]|uniref:FLYWCH-type domain-containing protein n=3 Tax=Schistosoma mattheei TaxID=31246 RepID=A0AA85B8C8_9TREM|nr:unnamed protein product [Schistosoma mattheei]
MLDVDILWRSVGNMNATSIKNFHTLTYDLEGTEAEETIIDGSSTGQLHNTLGNNLNPHSVKKNHDDKEKRQPNYRPSSTEESEQNFTTELVNKSNEGQWNLIKVRVGFDVTRKGERSLVINGYKFTKSRDGMGDRVFWRCSRRECKATAVTVSNKVEHIRSIHSHLPPVAAEFFSEDSSRCEQEVRFNNLVYTQRSRIRRRSQPSPSMKLSKQSVTKSCFLEQIKELASTTSCSVTSNAVSHKNYSSNLRSMDCSNDLCIDSSEYASPIKKRHCSDQDLSDYSTLQTVSALLTKWVDSKQVNIGNDEAKEDLSNISKCILPPKKLSNNILTSEEYQLFNSNSVLDVNNSSNVYEDSLSKVSKSESFKKLTTLATSPNNIYNHSSENDLIGINKTSQIITRDGTTADEDDSNRDFINDNSQRNSIINNMSKTQQSDISSPSIDVSSLEHNCQRQIILLNNEQLNELLKIINYSRFNNTPIQSESMSSPSLQTSSLVNDSLLNSIGLFTASDPNLTGGLAQCTTTYCCSYYPRLNSRVLNRNNDCCLPSFHHISSSTNLNSNPIVCSSFNNCSNNLFNKMSKSMAVSESNIDGCDTHVNGHKSSSPNFLIHWKKEKIRESVEEDGVNPLNGFYDNNDTFSHQLYQDKDHNNTLEMVDNHQISVNNTPMMNCSSQLLSHGMNNKLSSYNTFSSNSRTTNTTNSYDSSSNSSARELIQSQSEITIQSSDDDQFLYNQIQDGILMKILNTVQQLTAKLDADADPPEVIQNCRAIQACLDTITAIKRAKSNQFFIDKQDETRSTNTLEESNDNLQPREFTSKDQENFQLFSPNFIQS